MVVGRGYKSWVVGVCVGVSNITNQPFNGRRSAKGTYRFYSV